MKRTLRNGTIIDGRGGPPVAGMDITLKDGLIESITNTADRTSLEVSVESDVLDCTDKFILPGLIDAHVHLAFVPYDHDSAIVQQVVDDSEQMLTLREARHAQECLQAGITTVRDCGGRGMTTLAVRDAITARLMPGPRILASGMPITTTFGHLFFCGLEVEGTDNVRVATRRLAKEGADLIKVMVTGGIMTRNAKPAIPQYSQVELDALCEEARRLDKRVAAHVGSAEGVRRCVQAGVNTIEHCGWATCPNYEVVSGPLCVSVRRWGFPHSPVHPLFTPTRMHIDVTYTFYAGTPYFLKQGRMEMMRDFSLNYLRDDEWVFSGYPFTDALWMGSDGRLNEGEPAQAQQDDLWGVGFYNRFSRDAFVALHLEHDAEGFPGVLHHAGAPYLNCEGYAQLWSRWATRDDPFFPAGSVLKQRNAYLVSPYPQEGGAAGVERLWQLLRAPLQASKGDLPTGQAQAGGGRLARPGECGDSPISKVAIWAALRECRDDMLYTADANVVDLGYIRDVSVWGNTVRVLMTMPHHGRPRFRYLGDPIRRRLGRIPGVGQVLVDLTWNPAWSANDLTDQGWADLGLAPTGR